jgi:multidrug resistance efflux pump
MTTPFSKTFSKLVADHGRVQSWMLLATLAVLGGWCWWVARAHVTLYEVSPKARIEIDSSTYPVESPLLGRVVQTKLRVGDAVQRGEVLVEIDPVPEQLEFREAEVNAQGLGAEIERLRQQILTEQEARAQERHTAALSAEEARSRTRGAQAKVEYGEAELNREQRLHQEGLAPQQDVDKADADLRRDKAEAAELETAARRVPQEQTTRESEREVRIARLNEEIAAAQTQQNKLHAGMDRAKYEIERCVVRAPIDGRIGETTILRDGAVVHPGEQLASIVPSGRLFAVAQFPANAAFGRIREEQSATLRLDGFPWLEFGVVSAKVARVAEEVRDGSVRVEFEILPSSNFRGKLEHGMPGAMEISVERVTPLSLVLRTAGQWLKGRQ